MGKTFSTQVVLSKLNTFLPLKIMLPIACQTAARWIEASVVAITGEG